MSEFNSESNNAFWYDKNEYYEEYGLAIRTKKDGKSRSMKEIEKAEQRKKKVDDIVSSLPNKMQKKIAQVTSSTLPKKPSEPCKSTKQINYVSRQNTSEDVAYNQDDYEDDEYDVTDSYDVTEIGDDDYQVGLKVWKRFGFTKKQYDDDLEHRANIAALDAFEEDPENYHAPDYGEMLRQKIKTFEDKIERENASSDQDDLDEADAAVANYCWELYEAEILDNYRAIVAEVCLNKNEVQEFDDQIQEFDAEEDQEDEDDIAERYREDRLESAMENARDDMRDY